MNYENIIYEKSNREKRMTPQAGEWWCDSCDKEKVAVGKKCSNCRKIQGGKKRTILKKEPI